MVRRAVHEKRMEEEVRLYVGEDSRSKYVCCTQANLATTKELCAWLAPPDACNCPTVALRAAPTTSASSRFRTI